MKIQLAGGAKAGHTSANHVLAINQRSMSSVEATRIDSQ
jgi:hypothetical protein